MSTTKYIPTNKTAVTVSALKTINAAHYTEEYVAALRAAFERVQNAAHWKNPVDAVVDLNDAEMATLREAIIFFTGSVPAFKPRVGAALPRCRYRVQAIGYYLAVGA
jgi:hypothetical protein